MIRQRRFHRPKSRTSPLDVVQLVVVLLCGVWTAKLIVEERFGSFGAAASQFDHIMSVARSDRNTLTIRLDDGARAAVR